MSEFRKLNKSKKDWPEDFADENGNYVCLCVYCEGLFFGHKRRLVCKTCSTKPAPPETTPRAER